MRTPSGSTVLARSTVAAVLGLLVGCSAGDPPNPEDAELPATPAEGAPPAEAVGEDEEEPELSEAEDAALDALEEQFEDAGVKDIRGAPGEGVTIRLEDELAVADAAPFCDAVRAAGFPDVQVEIDGVVAACP